MATKRPQFNISKELQSEFDSLAKQQNFRMQDKQLTKFAEAIGKTVWFDLIDNQIQDALFYAFGYYIDHTFNGVFTVEPTTKTELRLQVANI